MRLVLNSAGLHQQVGDKFKGQAEMKPIHETLKFFLLCVTYWAFIAWGTKMINEEWVFLVNVIFIPFLFGAVGYLVFKSQSTFRIMLVTIASLFAALIAAKGGDQAKPGLHLIAIAIMTAITFMGAVTMAGFFIALQKLRFRESRDQSN